MVVQLQVHDYLFISERRFQKLYEIPTVEKHLVVKKLSYEKAILEHISRMRFLEHVFEMRFSYVFEKGISYV